VFKAFFLKWFFKKPLILLLGISFWKSWLLWDSVVNGFIGLKNIYIYIYIYIAKTSPSKGDLMSPFVFNIAVERLVILSGRAMENGLYPGIQLLAQIATLLQYADDTLIFCPNDIQVLKNVKTILNLFRLCSGLKIDFHKRTLIGVNVDLEFTKGVVGALRCKYSGLPIKYLGLPLGENPRLCST
jgi:hypothetical protein